MGRKKVIPEWNDKGEKKCNTCENFYPPEMFHYKTKCEKCYADYQAEYREKHREELKERKRQQRAARREGKPAAKRYRSLKELKEELEATLEEPTPECKFCPESDRRALRFLKKDKSYSFDEAMAVFRNGEDYSLICLNCDAKQLHALPLF